MAANVLQHFPGALRNWGRRIAAAVCVPVACLWLTAPGTRADDATPSPPWSIHTQATWIDQGHPSFTSPYEGANSFTSESQSERTFSFSLFLGYRVLPETEVYIEPEVLQGHGLSNTLGIAGFPNGEVVRASLPNLHYNTSKAFIRQTFGLGGDKEAIADGQNQVAGSQDVDRIILTVGKFAANDFFDDNSYSHDARSQFLNWDLWESAAWDYPADVVGYIPGFVAEWNTKDWMIHYGIFMEPTVSNGARIDYHVLDAHGQALQFDRRYTVGDLSGTFRPFVFWNQARMGNYEDALESPAIATALTGSRAYRSKVGLGISWDQQLTKDLGAFVRLSWDDGHTESFTFTEVDRSAAAGLSLQGGAWGRKNDTLGVAVAVDAIAPEHQAYLEAGGLEGLILGDGALDYAPEEVFEAFYDVQVAKWLTIAPDFQYVINPGYNKDRGPVPIYAIRAHIEF